MINASSMYSEIELTTDIMTASSHRLIELLLNKFFQKTELAKNFMQSKNFIKKSEAILGAFEILQYLRNCLNHENEKTVNLARLLDSVYAYSQNKLLEADKNNDLTCIDEANKLITEIKLGWVGIRTEEMTPA